MGISIKLNAINKVINKIKYKENLNQFKIIKKYKINKNVISK